MYYLHIHKRKQRKELEPKQSILKNKILKTVLFSLIASVSVLSMSFYFSEYSDSTTIKDVGLIFGILVGIVPLSIHQLKGVQRRDSIDRNMPMFLLGLLSSVRSGANLIKAIEQTADRNLGALTPELKNLRANMSWGTPIEDAFENFAERTGTRVAFFCDFFELFAFSYLFGTIVSIMININTPLSGITPKVRMFINVNKSNPPRLGLIIPIIDNIITASNGKTISKIV